MRARLIQAALLVGLAILPGAPSAHAAPVHGPPSDHLEMRRLAEVRERLERRRALQRDLQVQVDTLAAEIKALRSQGERSSAVLHSERQQARFLEQRLDRLIPRLLARMAELERRRAQAVGLLTDLARKSHSLRLDPRIRARLLAVSPLVLEHLRALDQDAGSSRRRPDEMIGRHAQIERSLPELMTAQQRLQRERAGKGRMRQLASDRLRAVAAEVRLLGQEQARLARHSLRYDAAAVARIEPQPDQRALPDLAGTRGIGVQPASVAKGAADPVGPVARLADAWNSAARAVAETPGAGAPPVLAAELTAAAGWPTNPPASRHIQAVRRAPVPRSPGAPDDAAHAGSALDVVFSPDGPPSGQGAGRPRGGRSRLPLLATPERSHDHAPVVRGGPEMTIAAAPGQAVAAPVQGRVVFAGRFKSYGLLLILEHEGEYHTLLWGFARLDVDQGEEVEVGQIVGMMDARGDDPPVLHVERRRNGRPVDIAASSNGIQG